MAQPVFQQALEEDLVQRVGTKLTLEVVVSAASDQEKVFFEWRGPAGSNAEDGRVVITEAGTTSRAEVTPLHLQVTCPYIFVCEADLEILMLSVCSFVAILKRMTK